MRLRLIIDNMGYEIDSVDPELLGKWVVEIFERTGPFTPATWVQVQAQPSWWADINGGSPRLDWIADSHFTGRLERITSPRDLLDALAKQLDELDALKEAPV